MSESVKFWLKMYKTHNSYYFAINMLIALRWLRRAKPLLSAAILIPFCDHIDRKIVSYSTYYNYTQNVSLRKFAKAALAIALAVTVIYCSEIISASRAYAAEINKKQQDSKQDSSQKQQEKQEKNIFIAAEEIARHKYTIQRIEQYLTRINTMIADFTQIAPDGSLSSGKLYLRRPGNMRWQYNPPTPVLMIANGSELIFYDYELQQLSHLPLDGSLISFLARDKINFGNDVGITSFRNEANIIRIEVAQHDKPLDGKLLLEFSDKPLLLRSMVITDAGGQVTTISLQNTSFGAEINPELFKFKDPRKPRKR